MTILSPKAIRFISIAMERADDRSARAVWASRDMDTSGDLSPSVARAALGEADAAASAFADLEAVDARDLRACGGRGERGGDEREAREAEAAHDIFARRSRAGHLERSSDPHAAWGHPHGGTLPAGL